MPSAVSVGAAPRNDAVSMRTECPRAASRRKISTTWISAPPARGLARSRSFSTTMRRASLAPRDRRDTNAPCLATLGREARSRRQRRGARREASEEAPQAQLPDDGQRFESDAEMHLGLAL